MFGSAAASIGALPIAPLVRESLLDRVVFAVVSGGDDLKSTLFAGRHHSARGRVAARPFLTARVGRLDHAGVGFRIAVRNGTGLNGVAEHIRCTAVADQDPQTLTIFIAGVTVRTHVVVVTDTFILQQNERSTVLFALTYFAEFIGVGITNGHAHIARPAHLQRRFVDALPQWTITTARHAGIRGHTIAVDSTTIRLRHVLTRSPHARPGDARFLGNTIRIRLTAFALHHIVVAAVPGGFAAGVTAAPTRNPDLGTVTFTRSYGRRRRSGAVRYGYRGVPRPVQGCIRRAGATTATHQDEQEGEKAPG